MALFLYDSVDELPPGAEDVVCLALVADGVQDDFDGSRWLVIRGAHEVIERVMERCDNTINRRTIGQTTLLQFEAA